MNFFAAQDQARRSSRRLVIVYILATIAIVLGVTTIAGFALFSFSQSGYGYTPGQFIREQTLLLLGIAILTTLFIIGSSLYKTSRLSAGGGRVAVDMGGTLVPTDVQDPLRRRLRNVVEEMAIASGVPVPEIYVMAFFLSLSEIFLWILPKVLYIFVISHFFSLLIQEMSTLSISLESEKSLNKVK